MTALEIDVLDLDEEVPDEEVLRTARDIQWRNAAPPELIRRIDHLSRRLEREFPSHPSRMLPTRIGNRMRVAEAEAFAGSSENYETAVLEVFHELPVHLQSQHDTHRRQLGLYATLMVVVVVTGGTAAVTLGLEHGREHIAWSVGSRSP